MFLLNNGNNCRYSAGIGKSDRHNGKKCRYSAGIGKSDRHNGKKCRYCFTAPNKSSRVIGITANHAAILANQHNSMGITAKAAAIYKATASTDAGATQDWSGNDGGGVPRVPIPNTTVKPSSANGTWTAGSWESRTLPGRRTEKAPSDGCFLAFFYG